MRVTLPIAIDDTYNGVLVFHLSPYQDRAFAAAMASASDKKFLDGLKAKVRGACPASRQLSLLTSFRIRVAQAKRPLVHQLTTLCSSVLSRGQHNNNRCFECQAHNPAWASVKCAHTSRASI